MTQPTSSREPDPFAQVQPPTLRDGLRQQILARARVAARDQPTIVDRLWESSVLRLAWAATVVLLLGVQVYLAPTPAETTQRMAQSTPAMSKPAEAEFQPFLARHSVVEAPTAMRLGGTSLFGSITIDPFS